MANNFARWMQQKAQERQEELANINAASSSRSNSIGQRTRALDSIFQRARNNRANNLEISPLSENHISPNDPSLTLDNNPEDDFSTVSEIDIELNNLLQSQTVSNILNSQRFRSSLEERLQNSLSRLNYTNTGLPPINAQSQIRQPGQPERQHSQEAPQQPQPQAAASLNHDLQESQERMNNVNISDVIDPNNDPELSALLNYQVVSNMLQSVFRTHLENTLWSRYVLRNQGNVRNNNQSNANNSQFSRRQDSISASDNIQQSNLLHSMRNEISEMRTMMRVMLQSQIETQRFMRHEMAHVFNAASRDPTLRFPEDLSNGCVICLNSQADTLMFRCGHLCLCYPCSMDFRISANGGPMSCPVCRSDVQEIIRVFTTLQQ